MQPDDLITPVVDSRPSGGDEEARAVGGQAETEHQQASSRAQGLPYPVLSAWQDNRAAKPELAPAKPAVWAADVKYIGERRIRSSRFRRSNSSALR